MHTQTRVAFCTFPTFIYFPLAISVHDIFKLMKIIRGRVCEVEGDC